MKDIILKILTGAAKSETIRFNGLVLALLYALMESGFFDLLVKSAVVQANPWLLAMVTGGVAAANILYRGKTTKPLTER